MTHKIISLLSKYWPSRVEVRYWDISGELWVQWASMNSLATNIWIVQPQEKKVQARYIRLWMNGPRGATPHPDFPDDTTLEKPLLQLWDFKLFEHRGGGGVFGLENLKTGEYSSISFAEFQPRQWGISSNRNDRSDSTYILEDIDKREEVKRKTQIVVTFDRFGVITLYRDGEKYGRHYSSSPLTWGETYDDARIVFGVRATSFVGEKGYGNFEESNLGPELGNMGQQHSSFFHGTIHRAVLIKGALLEEEVRGLYEVKMGTGMELGCHCYDACPVGSSKFYPQIPVPCSGSGACRRNETGEAFATGSCDCFPGFYGAACQYHCTEVSETGCCTIDDDCPEGFACNRDAQACGIKCKRNGDCSGGETCNLEYGACGLSCLKNSDCPGGLKCDAGRNTCARECAEDKDCAEGLVCHPVYKMCQRETV